MRGESDNHRAEGSDARRNGRNGKYGKYGNEFSHPSHISHSSHRRSQQTSVSPIIMPGPQQVHKSLKVFLELESVHVHFKRREPITELPILGLNSPRGF